MLLPRRSFLRFAAAGAGAILVGPHMALASVPSDRRFVFIIQRGAADGLNMRACAARSRSIQPPRSSWTAISRSTPPCPRPARCFR